jgi:hypothetical protein
VIKKGKSKNPDTTGSMKEEIPEYLGRESAKERKMMANLDWERGEKKQVLDGRRRKQNVLRERDN